VAAGLSIDILEDQRFELSSGRDLRLIFFCASRLK
jgi:hypothetical protein